MNTLRTAFRSFKKTEFVWRYLSNLRPTLSYAVGTGERFTTAESNVITSLRENGIAVTSIDALVDTSQFDELDRSVAKLRQDKIAEIQKLKLNAANENVIGSKTFNLEMLGSELTFAADDVFALFALNESFLKIANAYFRMISKLRYYNVWYTAASDSTARESQLWHFDREDHYILKAFLYLDDVDQGAGPFTYAPGTHKKGPYGAIEPEFFLEGGVRRTTDEQMRAVYPEEKWIRGIGERGTLILADTRGFHKGGEARRSDRLMYTFMYTSPASESKNLISFADNLDKTKLDRKQLRALGIR